MIHWSFTSKFPVQKETAGRKSKWKLIYTPAIINLYILEFFYTIAGAGQKVKEKMKEFWGVEIRQFPP
jgi:hypothetical protein